MKPAQVAFWVLCAVTISLVILWVFKYEPAKRSKCGPCHETAKAFRENLKSTVDPCDDFYEFACGNFPKYHPLPANRTRFSSFSVISDELRSILKKIVSSKGTKNEIKPFKYVRKYFKRMSDKSMIALERKLREVKTLEEIIWMGKKNGISLLVSVGLRNDPEKKEKRKTVWIDQPWLTLGREDLVANGTDVKAKKLREAYVKFISSSLKLFNPTREDTDAKAKKILALEMDLAKITTKKEERRDFNKRFNKFSKDKLFEVAPGFDLAKVVDGILGNKTVKTVVVADLPYYNNLSRVLKGKEDVVKDMMTFKLLYNYGWAVSAKFNDLEFDFDKVKSGLKKKNDLEEIAIRSLIGQVPNVMGRLYIDTVGFDEKDLKKMKIMIEKERVAMREMINQKDWMDDVTKAKAIKKLDAIRSNIGYPTWIKNDSELIKSFDIEIDESDGNFEILWKLHEFQFNDGLKKMDKPTDPEREWPSSPAVVNAFYNSIHNMIFFPAGILRGTFFNKGCPDSINYGGIGGVIGHEITHGFDDRGSQWGPDGRFVNWWSNETLKNFKKAAERMVNQYGSIVNKRTKLSLNGINTQGENIADNGGLRAAYHAYFSQEVNERKLIGFEDWSPEKLFFLSYATTWCTVATEESIRRQILYGAHSVSKYRVNVPLSNFQAFASAFNCRVGSKMNPLDKVRVW